MMLSRISTRFILVCSFSLVMAFFCPRVEAQKPVVFVSIAPGELRLHELAPLLSTLDRSGFAVVPKDVKTALGHRYPMPGHEPALTLAQFRDRLGKASAMAATPPKAEILDPALDEALRMVHANPEYLVRAPTLRAPYRELLVARAQLSRDKNHPEGAEAAMRELLRTAPEFVAAQTTHGPDVTEVYQLTSASESKVARGTLVVITNDPNVELYLNERVVHPNVPVRNLMRGTHRLVVLDSLDRSTRYEVPIRANQNTTIDIDWRIDPLLQEMKTSVLLRFGTESERLQRAELLRELVRTSHGPDRFVLLDVSVEPDKTRTVTATLYSTTSVEPLRRASAFIERDDAALRDLGDFIAGKGDTWRLTGVTVAKRSSGTRTEPAELAIPTSQEVARDPGPAWLIGGLGFAVVTGGTALWLRRQPSAHDPDPAGVYSVGGGGLLIAGGAAMAGSAYVLSRSGRGRAGRILPWIVGAGAVALETGLIMILLDEDGVSAPGAPVHDRATSGAIIGGVGALTAGVGGYLWWRATNAPVVPQLAITHGGAVAGFAVAF